LRRQASLILTQRGVKTKFSVSFIIFILVFLVSVGAFTPLSAPIPSFIQVPALNVVQYDESLCIVFYISRQLVLTLTPEVVTVAVVLGILFSFNVLVLVYLREVGVSARRYYAVASLGFVLAMLSSSVCWLACCSGGLFVALFGSFLSRPVPYIAVVYTGFFPVLSAGLLLANLIWAKRYIT